MPPVVSLHREALVRLAVFPRVRPTSGIIFRRLAANDKDEWIIYAPLGTTASTLASYANKLPREVTPTVTGIDRALIAKVREFLSVRGRIERKRKSRGASRVIRFEKRRSIVSV